MGSNLYKAKYMSQNALSYAFFCKRNLDAIRILYISLFVVENELGCKHEKVKEDEYEYCHQLVFKNCLTFLTNLSVFTKITKKSPKILQFWEAKMPKNGSLYYIHKK